jgi:phage-related protein
VLTGEPSFKPVVWIGSSRKDLREFPDTVQDHMGYGLYVAQQGGKHRDAKTLTGFGGAGVVKSSRTSRRHVPRGVHVAISGGGVRASRLPKKSKTGRETPRRDMELIKQRLREAERIARGGKP